MAEPCPICGTPVSPGPAAACPQCRAPLATAAADCRQAFKVAALGSALVYAVLIGVLFGPDVRAKMAEAFGERPLGLPVLVVVIACQTLLYVPIPFVIYHLALIGEQARREGRVLLGLSGLLYIVGVGAQHPHLARSSFLCQAGLGYVIFVGGIWIAYAASRGI